MPTLRDAAEYKGKYNKGVRCSKTKIRASYNGRRMFSQAGGLGLNLTVADTVIIADSDWNPQNDLQAMARAHRIGQTRAVRVYRLLTAKTYEMHMFHSASMKLGLERAVLSQQRDQGNDGEGGKSKSKKEKEAQAKEIDELLKKGAYDVFRDDNDEEAKKFMETDIDQLMERSAKTVTYGKQEGNLNSGLGSFSKASFVTDTGDGEKDVDLDDPDFWSKAVGLEKPVEVPEEISQMLDDGVKRSRKQVQQFDPYAEWVEEEDKKQAELDRKIQAEREEKQRIKAERKRMKEKKRKEREERKGDANPEHNFKRKKYDDDSSTGPVSNKMATEGDDWASASNKNIFSKKGAHRKRAILRMEQCDPAIEQLRQAWDISHRNRAIAACLRFGLSRLSKIRHESGLQSLPIHDVEVFCRSCTLIGDVSIVTLPTSLTTHTHSLNRYVPTVFANSSSLHGNVGEQQPQHFGNKYHCIFKRMPWSFEYERAGLPLGLPQGRDSVFH